MQPTWRLLFVVLAILGLLALSNVCHSDAAVDPAGVDQPATSATARASARVPGVRLCPGAHTCDGANEM